MSFAKQNIAEEDASRRKVFIIVGIITAILIAGMIYWAMRPHVSNNSDVQPHLEGALRAGAPEFAQIRERLIVDFNADQDATESTRPLGDIVMVMTPKVRNFTGRTINGLELQATVVDLDGKPVQQRTVLPIPRIQSELDNNKVLEVPIRMEGFKKSDTRANIKIEVTGVKFK